MLCLACNSGRLQSVTSPFLLRPPHTSPKLGVHFSSHSSDEMVLHIQSGSTLRKPPRRTDVKFQRKCALDASLPYRLEQLRGQSDCCSCSHAELEVEKHHSSITKGSKFTIYNARMWVAWAFCKCLLNGMFGLMTTGTGTAWEYGHKRRREKLHITSPRPFLHKSMGGSL